MKRIILGALALAALCAGPSVLAAETTIACTSAVTYADYDGVPVTAHALVSTGDEAVRLNGALLPAGIAIEPELDLTSTSAKPTDALGVLRMRRPASSEVLAGPCTEA